MASVIKVHIDPKIATPVLTFSNMIQCSTGIRFYFGSGTNVVCINKRAAVMDVYSPVFCTIADAKLFTMILATWDEIITDMIKKNIPDGEWFLFDVERKIVVNERSFTDWVPLYNIKHALFMLESSIGGAEEIYYMADQTDHATLILAATSAAKADMTPATGKDWSPLGKKMMYLLVSKRYDLYQSFQSSYGPWGQINWEFNKEFPSRALDISKLNLGRAISLTQPDDMPIAPFVVKSDRITLTDLIDDGVVTYLGMENDVIDIEIDYMGDAIKRVMLDTFTGQLLVVLQPNASLTLEEIKDALQYDTIDLINDSPVG